MNTNKTMPRIGLLGDMIRHVILTPNQPSDNDEERTYTAHINITGAPIVSRMISEALKPLPSKPSEDMPIIKPSYEIDYGDHEPRLISVLKYYPQSSNPKGTGSVLRVKDGAEYFAYPENYDENLQPKIKDDGVLGYIKSLFENCLKAFDNQCDPDILVIYDRNSCLRKLLNNQNNKKEKDYLQGLVKRTADGVVIAIRDRLDDIQWLHDLGKSVFSVDPVARDRCIVIITADALRKYGLNITEYGSIEQAVHEVVSQLWHSPLKLIIKNICTHLVVIFRETTALYINMRLCGGDHGKGSLHFCQHFDRIAQEDAQKFGIMPGKFTIILTAIVKELYHAKIENRTYREWDIAAALRLGVAAYNLHFYNGFCDTTEDKPNPFKALVKSVSPERREELRHSTSDKKKMEFLISSLDFDINQSEPGIRSHHPQYHRWNRTDALFKNTTDEGTEDKIFFNIVRDGLDKEMRRNASNKADFPEAMIICPYAEFGKIKMVDEQDIRRFYDLAKLIRKYLKSDWWTTPLSITVFGRPGSGKSTAVKEIINSVNPGRKSDPLIFNLAQFDSVEQLTEAFHQVQDRVLSSNDEVPLVIFDEFDSTFQQVPMGWLKYFLAPMQDGLFQGKAGAYRVGRAIFLFSGGTSYSFCKFKEKASTDDKGNSAERYKAAKLDDFISRLRGYLDISDINEEGYRPPGRLIKLRRAILLRSLLERHASPIFRTSKDTERADIQDGVIKAFLKTTKYEYGIRSMEAIIQMSRWINGQFAAASLPSHLFLEEHVNIESFRPILSDERIW